MLSSDQLARTKMRFNMRPVKFAYFVRDDDIAALKRAITFNCTQWGGVHNLLIPVKEDLSIYPVFREMLRAHCSERFVSYLPSSFHENGPNLDPLVGAVRESLPYRSVSVLYGPDHEEHDQAAHSLALAPRNLNIPSRLLRVHEFCGPEEDHLFLLAAFGHIFPGQEDFYAQNIGSERVPVSSRTHECLKEQRDLEPMGSVINLTSSQLRFRLSHGGTSESQFDVFIPTSPTGVCIFWNSRALREAQSHSGIRDRRTLLLPPVLLENAQCCDALVSLVRAAPHVPGHTSSQDITFWVEENSHVESVLEQMKHLPGVEQVTGGKIESSWFFGGDRKPREIDPHRVMKYAFIHPHWFGSYIEAAGRPLPFLKTPLEYGDNEVLSQPPDDFLMHLEGEVVVDFDSDIWKRYPRHDAIASVVLKNGWWSPAGISGGFIGVSRPSYLTISVPTEIESLNRYFQARGFQVRASPVSRYADAMIGLLGGLRSVEIIASNLAFRLLDTLAIKSSKKVAQYLKKMMDIPSVPEDTIERALLGAEVVPEMKRVVRNGQQLCDVLKVKQSELLPLIQRLSEHGIIRRGFHLECPHCQAPSWYPLEELHERLTCSGCAHSFLLPIERPVGSEIKWEYCLNTLVNRLMDQDVLPSLLATYHLTKGLPIYSAVHGLEIVANGRNDATAELDFVIVSDNQLWGGECKSGTALGEKDLETARMASYWGFTKFAFCTVREFIQDAQNAVQSLREELRQKEKRMEIVVLEGTALCGAVV